MLTLLTFTAIVIVAESLTSSDVPVSRAYEYVASNVMCYKDWDRYASGARAASECAVRCATFSNMFVHGYFGGCYCQTTADETGRCNYVKGHKGKLYRYTEMDKMIKKEPEPEPEMVITAIPVEPTPLPRPPPLPRLRLVDPPVDYVHEDQSAPAEARPAEEVLTAPPVDKIDGGWSEYGRWSKCDVECGKGTRTRTRTCSNPEPAGNGAPCEGDDTETKVCHRGRCPYKNVVFKAFRNPVNCEPRRGQCRLEWEITAEGPKRVRGVDVQICQEGGENCKHAIRATEDGRYKRFFPPALRTEDQNGRYTATVSGVDGEYDSTPITLNIGQ